MKVTIFDAQTMSDAPVTALPALLSSPLHTVWVDMVGPYPEDVVVLEQVFRFHPLAIEDTRTHFQRPKIEHYGDYFYIILNSAHLEQGDVRFREVDMFVGRNYFVTVSPPLEHTSVQVLRYCAARPDLIAQITPAYLLYLIANSVVESYFPILDKIALELEKLEEAILKQPRDDHFTRLFRIKRSLMEMWRVSVQQRDMFNVVITREQFTSAVSLRYLYRDVYDHLSHTTDMITTYRDTIASLMELYMSMSSNRLNVVINRLAVVTIIIGLFTVISGFYGMNFERTWPPTNDPNGALYALLLMIGLSLVTLAVLKWRRFF
jgi:magnesium transporter